MSDGGGGGRGCLWQMKRQFKHRQCIVNVRKYFFSKDVPRTLGEGKADYAAGNVGTDR